MSKLVASNPLLTLADRAEVTTLLDMARRQVEAHPDGTAVIFIPADGSAARHVTTKAFFDGAACYADALRKLGIGNRDLVILVMEHSEALLYAFWGAMMIGAIPSMFPFLSDKLDPQLYFERVKLLITHSGAKAVIASEGFVESLTTLLAESGTNVIGERHLSGEAITPDFEAGAVGDDVAFLQHSSGTTGLQKGVALPHRSVLNQIASYSEAIHLTPDDVIVSWLPLYHDMGLIAGFVLPITQGIPLVLMSPFHWVRDPKILLHAIHAHKGTLCWLPNFAYNLMATRIRDNALTGMRLETIRHFINCSEPMHVDSHRLFMERFRAYGLRETALATCYAMAENTFAVTQGIPAHENGGTSASVTVDTISRAVLTDQHRAIPATDGELSIEMLSCGRAIPNCTIRIVDDSKEKRVLPERSVGEVAVRSDSMLQGYYKRDDLTAEALFDGWYLTGDYGYLADGELYITGRKKDLIIVGGKNVYPQDLELIANQVQGVHPGRVVAFGVDDTRLGTENIVMVVEAESTDDDVRTEISKEVRRRVAAETDVTLSNVLVVDSMWLHKTSSGKIARGANRDKYLHEVGLA
ncbi:MAG: AMP-binding protein [Anaerolineae bacterium]|nr:AMP-binding protein [Anaerolineae bacterium]